MKQLFTSYFHRKGRDPNAVVISCTFPKWLPESEFQGIKRSDLAPLWPMVEAVIDGVLTSEEYSELYLDLLKTRGLTPQGIIDSLDEGSILICYEKPNEPCHRRTLATWLEEETGIVIPEWLTDKELQDKRQQEEKEQLVDSLLKF